MRIKNCQPKNQKAVLMGGFFCLSKTIGRKGGEGIFLIL